MSRTALLLILVLIVGCSGNDFPTARVEGTVRCNGVQLTSGVVYFAPLGTDGQPISGKSGGGVVGPDGKFTVSTYSEGDGAVVGRHRVVWQPEEEHAERNGAGCSREAYAEVEVPKGGVLDLVVDLQEPTTR
jgi:hypothetical protein